MSPVTSCPRCAARVSLPVSAPSESRVRCPLCGGEYRLQEAIEYIPPALVLIDEPASGEPRGASWMAAASIADTTQTEATSGAAAMSGATMASDNARTDEGDAIHFDDSLLLDETSTDIDLDTADTSGSGAMIGSSKAAGGMPDAGEPGSTRAAGGEDFFDNFVSDESPASSPESLADDDFRLTPPEERPSFAAADDVSDGATAIATAPPRTTRKSHPLLMLVGVVGGGLSGIVLGYAILMWAFGKDPAGVAKTLPDFLVPSSLQRSTTVAQGNQPTTNDQGIADTTFSPFGGEATDSGGVAGTEAAKADAGDPLTTTDAAQGEPTSDTAKRDPFDAIDDPSMKKSDPFGVVDDPLKKKADEDKGSEQPGTQRSIRQLDRAVGADQIGHQRSVRRTAGDNYAREGGRNTGGTIQVRRDEVRASQERRIEDR